MKIKLALIALLFPIFIFGQETHKAGLFFKQDETTLKYFFQSILDESGKIFVFKGLKCTQGMCGFSYLDKSTENSDSPRYVYFYCDKYEIGGNADLETKGKNVYSLSIAEGKFLDFANWWIKYMNPNETIETLSLKEQDKYKTSDYTLRFLKQMDGYWIIRGF